MLVTLLSRSGCHLCVQAQEIAAKIVAETGHSFEVIDVDQDLEMRAEYGDRVPVLLIDGAEHGYYTVEEGRLRAALTGG